MKILLKRFNVITIIAVAIAAIVIGLTSPSANGQEQAPATPEQLAEWHDNAISLQKAGKFKKAAKLYRLAAEQGYAPAQYSLGNCYSRGVGVKKNLATAAEWYGAAADQGYGFAQRELGEMYAKGQGVEHNDTIAVELYRKAADRGLAHARFLLAEMYANGRGVERNDTIAFVLYRLAAESNHIAAQHALGEMYQAGRGVTQSNEQAEKWFQTARTNGYAEMGY